MPSTAATADDRTEPLPLSRTDTCTVCSRVGARPLKHGRAGARCKTLPSPWILFSVRFALGSSYRDPTESESCPASGEAVHSFSGSSSSSHGARDHRRGAGIGCPIDKGPRSYERLNRFHTVVAPLGEGSASGLAAGRHLLTVVCRGETLPEIVHLPTNYSRHEVHVRGVVVIYTPIRI